MKAIPIRIQATKKFGMKGGLQFMAVQAGGAFDTESMSYPLSA